MLCVCSVLELLQAELVPVSGLEGAQAGSGMELCSTGNLHDVDVP